MLIFLVAFICAVLTFIIVFLLILYVKRIQSLNVFHRLRRHSTMFETIASRNKVKEPLIQRVYKYIKRISRPFTALEMSKELDFKLKQAGVPLYGAEFIIISVISAVIGAMFIYIITLNTFVAPAAGASVPVGMWLWVTLLIARRRRAFTEQLGDCLTTVANALRAGYSFQQAMDVVSKEMEPPISTEFARVMTDIAMGVSLEDALEQMNRRVNSPDFDLVVTAVLIQREIGGNLAQILDTISDTINERIRMKREIAALTAQGRFSSWILIALPFVTAVFCWMFNRDQMQLFITEEAGHVAIAVAIIMEIIGFVVIQKIVDIEV